MKRPTILAVIGLGASLLAYHNREASAGNREPPRKIERETVSEPIPERMHQEPKQKKVAKPWTHYELKGFPEYNRLLPVLYEAGERHNLSLDQLAVIALTETQGKSRVTFEPTFFNRYLKNPPKDVRNRINKLYHEVRKEQPRLTYSQFMRQLATAAGPMQRVYVGALEAGFKGTLREFASPRTNIEFAARHLRSRGINRSSTLEETLRAYNTGSKTEIPTKGYRERAEEFCNQLGIKYTR